MNITLPDGKVLSFEAPVTIQNIAATIGSGLAKAALAGKVNQQLVDLSYLVTHDVEVSIITNKSPEALELIRHSAAHLLAQAVCELFPGAYPTVGPAIEDGFYHDFYYPAGFSEADLVAIESKMQELVKANYPITRSTKTRAAAMDFYTQRGEIYKVKMLEDIPAGEEITFYTQGDFTNVCRGPHVPSTGCLGAFKLTKLAGAYWHGDSKNEMLPRIYGTAWASKKELDDYLARIEKAKQNDHRLVGKKMDLFHLQEEAPGIVFWHPHGWSIFTGLKNYLIKKLTSFGYQEVNTPQILDSSLWEKSGHWDKFGTGMFTTESESRIYALKPMNCPGHIQIFKQGIKSYRDLPLRFCEFGVCHRNEPSGTLHGIMRVRAFTQDDGHIFCTEDQVGSECAAFVAQVVSTYAELGFHDITVRLATRPAKRIGSDEIWDKAEQALQDVLNLKGITWEIAAGEGAFYGPKIEFSLRDSLNRVWQCGTLQVDFSMPSRLEAHYIAEDGSKKPPVMLHRAMLGSLERFIGILLEETGGDLPIWLAPVQVAIINITDAQADYAQTIAAQLTAKNLRVNCDLRNEKIGFKIREHAIARVPFIIVVGDRELQTGTVTLRRHSGEDLGSMQLEEVLAKYLNVI